MAGKIVNKWRGSSNFRNQQMINQPRKLSSWRGVSKSKPLCMICVGNEMSKYHALKRGEAQRRHLCHGRQYQQSARPKMISKHVCETGETYRRQYASYGVKCNEAKVIIIYGRKWKRLNISSIYEICRPEWKIAYLSASREIVRRPDNAWNLDLISRRNNTSISLNGARNFRRGALLT